MQGVNLEIELSEDKMNKQFVKHAKAQSAIDYLNISADDNSTAVDQSQTQSKTKIVFLG
jgi:hypothetical protein